MIEKRFSRKSVEDLIVEKGLDSIVDLLNELSESNEQLKNKLELATARSGYYQRMFEKWCVK